MEDRLCEIGEIEEMSEVGREAARESERWLPASFQKPGVMSLTYAVGSREAEKRTRMAIGYDTERKVFLFYCKGEHDHKYTVNVNGEVKEAEPFEGLITVDETILAELYLVASGALGFTVFSSGTKRLRIAGAWDVGGVLQLTFSFTDYEKVRRTKLAIRGMRTMFLRSFLAYIKDNYTEVLRYTYREETEYKGGARVQNQLIVKYTPAGKKLVLVSPYSEAEISGKSLYDFRVLLEAMVYGKGIIRPYYLRDVVLYPSGMLHVSGPRKFLLGTAKTGYGVGNEIKNVPALLLQLHLLLS